MSSKLYCNSCGAEVKKNDDYWAKTPSGYVCIKQGNKVYCKKI